MPRFLLCFCILVLLASCKSSPTSPSTVDQPPGTTVLLVDRFKSEDTLLFGKQTFMISGYRDLEGYDPITVTFSAKNAYESQRRTAILIKFSPSFYAVDTLRLAEDSLSFVVPQAKLVKPHYTAITLTLPDSGTAILLSHLRVTGRMP